MKRAYPVLHINPTPPLATIAHIPAQTETEREQHFLQSAAFATEDQARAHVDGSYPGTGCRFCCSFPLTAYFRQKTLARWGVFSQKLIATITVIADRRPGNQDPRPISCFG